MPVVNLPDGKRINFPDGTSMEEMQGAIQSLSSGPTTEAPKEVAPISPIQAFNESAQNALSFGMLPALDASAGVAANAVKGIFGKGSNKTYDDYLRDSKSRLTSASEQNPKASLAGDIVGLAGGVATGSTEAKLASAAPSVWSQMKTGAKLMAPIMGVQQFATTEGDLGDKATAGGIAAALGLTLGGALPLAVSAIPAAGRGIKSAYTGVVDAVKRSGSTAEELANMQLKNALTRDSIDPMALAPNKNLLQSGGRATISRAESIAARENPASDKLIKYSYERADALPEEISGYLGQTFKEGDYPMMLNQIKEATRAKAAPAYKEAYDAVTEVSDPQINKVLDRVVNAGDWSVLKNEAGKIAAYEGNKLGNIGADGLIKSFSTKDLDYMTRALRKLGQATEGMGAMGGRTEIGAMRGNAAMEIRSRLGEINTKFGDVTKQYADDVAIYEAAEAGKTANLFGNNWKTAISDYKSLPNETAKQAWRVGKAEDFHRMIAMNPNAALRKFNTPHFKKIIESFYSPEEAKALLNGLNSRLMESGSLQRITQNSRTAARAMQQADDAAMSTDGVRGMIADSVVSGVVPSIRRRVGGSIASKLTNSPKQQAADAIVVDQLLATPPNKALLDMLLASEKKKAAQQSIERSYSPYVSQMLLRSTPLLVSD